MEDVLDGLYLNTTNMPWWDNKDLAMAYASMNDK